jgi:hypothetical protein
MWKRKGSLWVSSRADEDPEVQSTSPKPHPTTVWLAFLSPALAVVATVISIWTFIQGHETTMIGQRAYLYPTDPTVVVKEARLSNLYTIWLSYTIKNLGKTPGNIINIRYLYRPVEGVADNIHFRLLRDRDNLEDDDNTPQLIPTDQSTVREIGPVLASVSEGFGLDPLGRKATTNFPIHVIAVLTYKDVFNKTQVYKWCWTPVLNDSKPSSCDSTYSERPR